MGEVAILFEVMPDGVEIDLVQMRNVIESRISDICRIQAVEERPIAFGLKALAMNVVVEDTEGVMDRLEQAIGGVDGVQNAKVVGLTKL
jgi:elongation factor 1-beta